ncbi:hypothetical protein M0802_010706 [Mischocyttarus mexicanus]|nr:hypothetical protein M0802_010706 [Mischocyttarus mexicanus]
MVVGIGGRWWCIVVVMAMVMVGDVSERRKSHAVWLLYNLSGVTREETMGVCCSNSDGGSKEQGKVRQRTPCGVVADGERERDQRDCWDPSRPPTSQR